MALKNRNFVVQEHITGDDVHWDLMLETAEALEVYRITKPPEKIAGEGADAIKIVDHPKRFLTYEGTVQAGTGKVKIVEMGTYCPARDSKDPARSLDFAGEVLKGRFEFTPMGNNQWRIVPAGPPEEA